MPQPLSDTAAAWALSLSACLACIAGAAIVLVDPLLAAIGVKHTHLIHSRKFIAVVLAFGSGVMAMTSIMVMLPNALTHARHAVPALASHPYLALAGLFSMGMGLTYLVSRITAWFTPQAVPCGCHHDSPTAESHLSPSHSFLVRPSVPIAVPTLTESLHHPSRDRLSTHHSPESQSPNSASTSRPASYGAFPPFPDQASMSRSAPPHRREFLMIAVQTAAAIAIHKLPEGLVTFIGRTESPELGWSVFVALAVHNFPEGMTLAVPFYMLTGSRSKAFGIAAAITGLVQPLGAVLGYILVHAARSQRAQEWTPQHGGGSGPLPTSMDTLFAIVLPCVAGMMVYIVLTGTMPLAFEFNASPDRSRLLEHGDFLPHASSETRPLRASDPEHSHDDDGNDEVDRPLRIDTRGPKLPVEPVCHTCSDHQDLPTVEFRGGAMTLMSPGAWRTWAPLGSAFVLGAGLIFTTQLFVEH
ncbi:hypothetical protein H4R34_001110 [Dimargaris verticillata]|uniref:Zinc/iron permease n=1 Tax=Dimargaris verticillata TaxID=2761393 RepID=A0A9W8B527_9FUNG|nr:hypothetical protein H4R34_001110 [Dimargaris verticillata]